MSVSIDNDFARFGAKSYAINKITSVEIRELRSQNGGCMVALFVIPAALCALAGLGSLSSETGIAVFFLILAAIFGGVSYVMIQRAKRVTYQLFLITSASEQQAYESRDPQDVYRLRDQVEAAMLHHSRGIRG